MRHQKGFTLVELVIALSVFSFALVIGLVGFITVVKIYRNSLAQRDSQVYARAVMDTIVRDARAAKNVTKITKPAPDVNYDDFCLDLGGSGQRYFTSVASGAQQYSFGKIQFDPQATCAVDNINGVPGDVGTRQYVTSAGNAAVTTLKITPIVVGAQNVGMQISVSVAYRTGKSFLNTASTACTPGPGSEYCATTTLTSSVIFRGGNL